MRTYSYEFRDRSPTSGVVYDFGKDNNRQIHEVYTFHSYMREYLPTEQYARTYMGAIVRFMEFKYPSFMIVVHSSLQDFGSNYNLHKEQSTFEQLFSSTDRWPV